MSMPRKTLIAVCNSVLRDLRMLLLRRMWFRCWCCVWLGTRFTESPGRRMLGGRLGSSPATLFLIVAAAIFLVGCQSKTPMPPKEPAAAIAESRTSVALRVLVVNDQSLAEAIERLRGEWHEVSGGELTAAARAWSEIAVADELDADVVIFPTRYMGELCVRGWLRPVRKSVLDDKTLDFDDFFPLVRRQLIMWGGQVMALPLGIDFPGLTINWNPRGAVSYFVAVAPKAVEPTRIGDLFDPKSMTPRIDDPALAGLFHRDAVSGPESLAAKRVPVLGFGDRMASVTTSTRNAASAFKLLGWLASADVSSQLARAEIGSQPARKSLASSAAWHSRELTEAERGTIGKNLQAALRWQRRSNCAPDSGRRRLLGGSGRGDEACGA